MYFALKKKRQMVLCLTVKSTHSSVITQTMWCYPPSHSAKSSMLPTSPQCQIIHSYRMVWWPVGYKRIHCVLCIFDRLLSKCHFKNNKKNRKKKRTRLSKVLGHGSYKSTATKHMKNDILIHRTLFACSL